MDSIVIYLGGNGPDVFPNNIDRKSIAKVIAADSGIELAQQHDIDVDVLIGDLDSALPTSIKNAEKSGTKIIEFDQDKDFTDFELAIAEAKNYDATHLIIIGGGGKRTDHLLANISVLCGIHTSEFFVDVYFNNEI